MATIKLYEGVANDFKSQLQSPYDFLSECENAVSQCDLLESLGIDNGSNEKIRSYIAEQRDSIGTFQSSMTSYEEQILNLDDICANILDNL